MRSQYPHTHTHGEREKSFFLSPPVYSFYFFSTLSSFLFVRFFFFVRSSNPSPLSIVFFLNNFFFENLQNGGLFEKLKFWKILIF
jgi:hypothetical protein